MFPTYVGDAVSQIATLGVYFYAKEGIVNAITLHRKDIRLRAGLEGVATITLDQKVKRVHRDDLLALRADWERVSKDLRRAMTEAKREHDRNTA